MRIVEGLVTAVAAILIGGATVWAISKIRDVGGTSTGRPAVPIVDHPVTPDPAPPVASPPDTPRSDAGEFRGQAAEPVAPPAPRDVRRPSAFDASAGTRVDPLTLKGWDLSAPKTVPNFDPPKPRSTPGTR